MKDIEGYLLYAEEIDDRARRQADDFDNAFGNLLRGNGTDSIEVVLEKDGEGIDSYSVSSKDEVPEQAEELLEEYGIGQELERENLSYSELARE